MLYTETMRLIPNPLENLQGFRFFIQIQWNWIFGKENFFQSFCYSDDGNFPIQPEEFQAFHCGTELTFSAVYQNQLRQWFALIQKSAVSAIDDFSHRSKIIRPFHGFYMKNPIICLAGLPIFENHTRRNGIGPLNIRIVKTFYMPRLFGKSEELFHLRHDAVGMSFWIYYLHLL